VKTSRNDDLKKRSEALAKIKALKAELDKGADFAEMAEKKSETPGAKNGGDLGFFTRGQMIPEIEKAACALPVGGISDLIESEFGYHIIQVTEKKASRKLKYDDIKTDLAGIIYQKKSRDRYEEYINELKKKADVKITLDVSNIKVDPKK
jgi:parvulin-like peptidyl-prolyl isomerase